MRGERPERATRTTSRRVWLYVLASAGGVLALALTVAYLAWDLPQRAREAVLSRGLDADIAAFRRRSRWPPTLVGRPVAHCNAAEEIVRAVARTPGPMRDRSNTT